jgi:hypothetical protein
MKLATQRHEFLDRRSLASSHHIECDCGTTFSHEFAKGIAAQCPHCGRREEITGVDVAANVSHVRKVLT